MKRSYLKWFIFLAVFVLIIFVSTNIYAQDALNTLLGQAENGLDTVYNKSQSIAGKVLRIVGIGGIVGAFSMGISEKKNNRPITPALVVGGISILAFSLPGILGWV